MATKSPVFSAVKQILHLLDLTDEISLYSYREDFTELWELDAPMPDTNPIWCVVDDSFGQFHWLPIGVWGHYYRAKGGFNSPKLILMGEDEGLNPKANKESVFVPDFYRNEEDCIKSVKLNDVENSFIVNLLNSKASLDLIQSQEEAEAFSPKAQSIEGWKGIIRNALSLPEKRHRISNEIAPIELRNALETLKQQLGKESSSHKREINIIEKCLLDHKVDQEKRALLTIWNWVAPYDKQGMSPQMIPPRIKDIWDIWSNAKFMLIDDQGISNGFDKIVKCALALMMNKGYENINLECREKLDISSEDLINNYGCLLLDLRLGEKDIEERDYRELGSYKFAIEVANKCPAFPIIIFSSSQQREIDKDLSIYGNIIGIFRKPGIAGSLQAIDGDTALQNLFAAINRAFEMMENRLVYSMIPDSSDYYYLRYKNMSNAETNKKIQLSRDDLKELFKEVFWLSRYNTAFTFPYSFLESQFSDADKNDLIFISQIGIKGNSKAVSVQHGDLSEKATGLNNLNRIQSNTKITKKDASKLKPIDLLIEQWTRNMNLNLRFLHVFRNLYSHSIQKYKTMRREAIVVLLLLLATLKNDIGDEKEYSTLAELELLNKFPLIYPCKDSDIDTFIREVFSLTCYYGGTKIYNKMYTFVVTSGK